MEAARDRFWKEVIEVENPTPKTQRKYAAALNHIVDHFGARTLITAVDRAACIEFRDIVAVLTPNFTKLSNGTHLPLRALAQQNADGSMGRMAYDTQGTYVRMMGRLFGWAYNETLISMDVARDIKPRARRVPQDERRDPFTLAELSAIFNAPLYRGCIDDERHVARPGPT